ncbi:hypothetical protein [Asanoa sp. NPDC050611]|uniref:hypothetical protein n=1 Tax=Asanoa sp. NPDC050611 TaxID=3157098 RepID=UPI0033D0C292
MILALATACESGGQPAAPGPVASLRAAAAKTASVSTHTTMTVPQVEVSGDVDPSARNLALADPDGVKLLWTVRDT